VRIGGRQLVVRGFWDRAAADLSWLAILGNLAFSLVLIVTAFPLGLGGLAVFPVLLFLFWAELAGRKRKVRR
jgi:hypothetical protein